MTNNADSPSLLVSPSAYNRIGDIRKNKNNSTLYLRVAVSGGGCSGFRYDMTWDENITENDCVVDDVVLVDDVSIGFLAGATLDYAVTMMGENFKIINPNATSGCGCGESFSL